MNKHTKGAKDLPGEKASTDRDATTMEIQTVRSQLVNHCLLYFAVVVPLALTSSLFRTFEHGWHPIYLIHLSMAGLVITIAVFRKRLSYPVRASVLLILFLVNGSAGLPAFGLVGGALTNLIAFAVMAGVAFGIRAGLIACAIDIGIMVVTGAAVCTGVISFSFDISEYATSITAWGTVTTGFILWIPVTVIALGVVHKHLAASLQDLQESQANHERLVDNLVGSFLYRHDVEGVFNYVSSSVTQILGYSTEAFLTHFTEYLTDHPANQEVVKHTKQSINGVQEPPYEVQIYHKDGSVHWLEVSETPVRGNNGKVVAVEGVAHIITDRKRMEDALKKAHNKLEHRVEQRTKELRNSKEEAETAKEAAEVANMAKSEFLANMSHELRTPLNAILGFSQLMVSDRSLAPVHRENLDIINRSGEHLLGLINDVLDMSKIEAGRITRNKQSFDLHHMLRGIEDMMRFRAEGKGLQFTLHFMSDLPQFVKTDEGKLRQVLINLIINAVKFTTRGQIILRVSDQPLVGSGNELPANTAEEESSGDLQSIDSGQRMIFFEIKDTGTGILADKIDTLFNPFVQAQKDKGAKEGSGLGLTISKKFVQLMGGDITVESRVGQGSVFRFNIEIDPAGRDKIETKEAVPKVIGLAPDQPEYCILIVEDFLENRLLLRNQLEMVGFNVIEATNGKECIEQYENRQPHLIIMDIRMPVMDGFEATRLIRAIEKQTRNSQHETRNIPIIALTASAFEQDRKKVLAAGCDDFIRKPFKGPELFKVIRKHLGVTYIYENDRVLSDKIEKHPSHSLTPSDLKDLPKEWLVELNEFALMLDDGSIRKVIERIGKQNAPVASALTDLTNDYRFDKILDLVKNNMDKEIET